PDLVGRHDARASRRGGSGRRHRQGDRARAARAEAAHPRSRRQRQHGRLRQSRRRRARVGGITMLTRLFTALMVLVMPAAALAQPPKQSAWPNQRDGDFVLKDYRFASGETLSELKIHYTTLGTARRNAAGEIVNGVLLLHGTSGTGKNWLMPSLADELFGPGQPLDASQYFIVLPDGVGRGGSSQPSDGLRAKFPHYRYRHTVDTERGMSREDLTGATRGPVLGSSWGGRRAGVGGEFDPALMDALVPIATPPIAISGRNWISRRIAIEAIRNDPDWNNGNY